MTRRVAFEHLLIGQTLVADRVRVLFRILAVDPVDAGRLEKDIDAEFAGEQGGRRVGRDEGPARPAGEDHDAAHLEVAGASAADVRLGDPVHADGGHEPGFAPEMFQHVLNRKAVDDGPQHPHVVGCGRLDDVVGGAELRSADDVAAAHDDRELGAGLVDGVDLPRDGADFAKAYAGLPGGSQAFAADLEQDAPGSLCSVHRGISLRVGRVNVGRRRLQDAAAELSFYSAAGFAAVSPTSKRTNRATVMFSLIVEIFSSSNWRIVSPFVALTRPGRAARALRTRCASCRR